MFSTFRNAWKVPELRKKILYTLLIILIFRIGCHIPVPFLDTTVLSSMITDGGSFLSYMDILSGGALSKGTLFALAIQPYINASIIVQLLTYALPPLENLQKEGEEGRKKLNTITMFVTLGISLVMSYAYYVTQRNNGAVKYTEGASGVFAAIVIIAAFTAGSCVVVWLGNRINDNGIGNGISMILFAGIVSRGPSSVLAMFELVKSDQKYILIVPVVLIVFVLMIAFIVFMNESERRIPIQYAKRVVGRKQYGGQNTHIPIKIAMSGVMPIIFAMSIMSLPATLEMFIPVKDNPEGFWQKFYAGFIHFFSYQSGWYAILYFILIIAFNYFYVAMQYNPIEIANNLRQNNGAIPGIRPGKPTSDYIQRVLSKITLIGAVSLGIIAIFPILTNMAMPQLNIAMGGTSILIIVSVVLETVRTLESQMMMRHHKGFLE
ncbi:MAG: preprotein translocase subunit SecY [Oscillospiraceae bacterium]|nr:preprotein translocase subunit SecY [Oscillospiraceae bacterium]